jgi:hypothetical protein
MFSVATIMEALSECLVGDRQKQTSVFATLNGDFIIRNV